VSRPAHALPYYFELGRETARVFDDILLRSVPQYVETQRMMAELTIDFALSGTRVSDLGCSTGTTFVNLDPLLPKDVAFVGVDSSPEMLNKADEKLAQVHVSRPYDLRCGAIEDVVIEGASVAILNLTFQFVRPSLVGISENSGRPKVEMSVPPQSRDVGLDTRGPGLRRGQLGLAGRATHGTGGSSGCNRAVSTQIARAVG
jgi:SAM-dependent methyltransferase